MSETGATRPAGISEQLLRWYDRHHRSLPWRAPPGARERPDPYRVWLSEVMLQQTTVAAVQAYYRAFLARWPTVEALAAAPLDQVLAAWAGLGYYARARNLHRCAGVVATEHGGCFPDSEEGLRALPGIGRYTAAAIAAIAFGRPAVVVDGNVERVMARLFAVTEPLPGAKPALYAHAAALTPRGRPGDHAQALMDLGATVCTARSPACGICPLLRDCAARAAGIAAGLPLKAAKQAKPVRHGVAWLAHDGAGRVLTVRRPPNGLLGGMLALPSSVWREAEAAAPAGTAEGSPPLAAEWHSLGEVRHTFTHFHLRLELKVAEAPLPDDAMAWREAERAMPTVFAKAMALARPVIRGAAD